SRTGFLGRKSIRMAMKLVNHPINAPTAGKRIHSTFMWTPSLLCSAGFDTQRAASFDRAPCGTACPTSGSFSPNTGNGTWLIRKTWKVEPLERRACPTSRRRGFGSGDSRAPAKLATSTGDEFAGEHVGHHRDVARLDRPVADDAPGGDGDQCRDEELLHVDLVSVHQVPLETVEKLRFDRGATLVH